MLAAAAAFSLGMGTAMAQDSAFFTEQAQQWPHAVTSPASRQAAPITMQPQAGSSDVERSQTSRFQQQVPMGGDGSAG
jgi:hypothetical protein